MTTQVVCNAFINLNTIGGRAADRLDNPHLRDLLLEESRTITEAYRQRKKLTPVMQERVVLESLQKISRLAVKHGADRIQLTQPWLRDDGFAGWGQTVLRMAIENDIPVWLSFQQGQEHGIHAIFQEGVNMPTILRHTNPKYGVKMEFLDDMQRTAWSMLAVCLDFFNQFENPTKVRSTLEDLDILGTELSFRRVRLPYVVGSPEWERISTHAKSVLKHVRIFPNHPQSAVDPCPANWC